jgi:hypothetical protein
MFDVFVGEVRCPNCASEVRANIQTYVRDDDANGSSLVAGTELIAKELVPDRLVRLGYTQIAEPQGGTIRLLDVWSCSNCNTEQWGMVTIADARVHSIEAVRLTKPVFEGANYISQVDAEIRADAFSKEPDRSTVEVLRKNLPPA